MKTALFTNFSDEAFTGYWNGKGKTFQPGQSIYMPDYLAQHFAKHLVNRELLSLKPDGTPKYKNGEKMTSPKKPEEVPAFMELFKKAYTPDEEEDEISQEGDGIDSQIAVANRNREKEGKETNPPKNSGPQNPNEPQIVVPPDFDDDDDESEEEVEGAQSDAQNTPQNK